MKKVTGTRIHTNNPVKVQKILERSGKRFSHFENDPNNFYIEGIPPSYWQRLNAVPKTMGMPAYGIQEYTHISWYKREKVRDLWYQKLELSKEKNMNEEYSAKIYKKIARKY